MSERPAAGTSAAQTIHPWVADGERRLRFGVGPQRAGAEWPEIRDWVLHLESLGCDSFWVQDHPSHAFDCWTTLAALAVATRTIRLGTMVNCVYYRSPYQLARLATDVDRISGGRLVLGIGIGDAEAEFAQQGIPFAPTRERQATLAETIHIVRGLWGGTPFTYEGARFRVHEAMVSPGPIQAPHIPLVIAGGGERVTLRQVAQYADMCNFGGHHYTGGARTLDDVQRKLDVLHRHCQALGRPPEAILRSHIALPLILGESPAALQAKLDTRPPEIVASLRQRGDFVVGTAEEAIPYYQGLVAAGMRYFTLATSDADTVRVFAEHVLPALALP